MRPDRTTGGRVRRFGWLALAMTAALGIASVDGASRPCSCPATRFGTCPDGTVQVGNHADGSPLCEALPPPPPPAQGGDGVLLDSDGMLRIGNTCDEYHLVRSFPLAAGDVICGRNGDRYTAAAACTTGAARPAGLPYAAVPGLPVPAGAIVYSGWGNAPTRNLLWAPSAACQLGATLPTWCGTAGCTVTSGSCTLTARAATPITVTDGTCTLTWSGFDIESGQAPVEIGSGFPGTTAFFGFGDNQPVPLQLGRGDYGGEDEQFFAGGGFAGPEQPGTFIRAQTLGAGLGIHMGPTVRVSGTPPPLLVPIAGTTPATWWGCFATAFPNTYGGSTLPGPLLCAPAVSGGVRVAQPERGGWLWPNAFPVGRAMAAVYFTWLPGAPCTPPAGLSTCMPENPDRIWLTFRDYLQTPDDVLDFTSNQQEEFHSPTSVNSTGMDVLSVYDPSVGFGFCHAGPGWSVGVPCLAQPNTGYWYATYGFNCDANCEHCDRRRGVAFTVTALPQWRTDRTPVCGTDGVAWQMVAPAEVGVVLTESGYGQPRCVLRTRRPKADGTGHQWVLGLCNGQLEFYGPGGVNDVRFRCGPNGCS